MQREFQIIKGLEWPPPVCEGWDQVVVRGTGASYVQTLSWNQACMELLEATPESALLILAYQGETLEAIFPFIVDERRELGITMRVLRPPRHEHINWHDIALSPDIRHDNLLTELLSFLKRSRSQAFDLIEFGNVLDNSATLQLLRSPHDLRSTIVARNTCHCLPATSNDELGDLVSKNLKGNLRKARRRLSNYESAEFSTTRKLSELPDFFADFLEVEASGWKGAGGAGTAIVLHPSLTAFYRRLMHEFGAGGQCEINLLKIDGRVAAGQFALIVGNTMFLLKIGFNEEFSGLAPGNLLLAETLHRANKEGEIEVVNLITDAGWHASWRPIDHTVYECCCYTRTARGSLAYSYRRLRSALGPRYRAARERMRRAIGRKAATD